MRVLLKAGRGPMIALLIGVVVVEPGLALDTPIQPGSAGGSIGGSLAPPAVPRRKAEPARRPPVRVVRHPSPRPQAPHHPISIPEESPPPSIERPAAGGSGPRATTQRAAFCARTYPADYYSGWVGNHCTRAPYGPRFEYLTSAWRCLCLD